MFYVYILHSQAFDKYYVGQTKDLQVRLRHHNAGLDRFTKKYLPWELLFYVVKDSRSGAICLERKLKNLSKLRLQQFITRHIKEH
ncbi:MAG TPA: GIY-YIG nuclease family protein [Chitinophagaceae bacterium]|nr:GIY-YIG nuclease family protein [Chitinophagaceae bacterium]